VGALCSGGQWVPCVQVASGCPVFRWPVGALCPGGQWVPCVQVASGCPVSRWPVGALCSGGQWVPCVQVVTPNIYNMELWNISGHAANYKENMFVFDVSSAAPHPAPAAVPLEQELSGI